MSKLNIACLLSPMANTEGPMEIVSGNILTGAKKIMGKYGEVGLEATITYGEQHPNLIHTDILSIGKGKEVTTLQQQAIATLQPGNHPGTLGVHALELEDVDSRDAFNIASLLVGMIQRLENKPDLILVGRESFDYGHGVVGPAVAEKLGYLYVSGVNEIALNEDMRSVKATFIHGNDKLTYQIPLPAVFGTTDWLNGKDGARFTSLKGVMMAKKFSRDIVSMDTAAESSTAIDRIEVVTSERRNRKLQGDDGAALAREAFDILVNQDKALALGGTADHSGQGAAAAVAWSDADASGLGLEGDVVVVADHDGSAVRLSTHQVLSQARKVADAAGLQVSLLLLAENADSLAAGSAGFGADRVIAVEQSVFKHPTLEACAGCLKALLPSGPAVLFTVANDLGRDLAATMACAWNGGLLQDVIALDASGDRLAGSRIVANARFTTHERITAAGSQVVSVRATAFDPVPSDRAVSFIKAGGLAPVPTKAVLEEVTAGEKSKGIPLNEAKIIVSGGRGMKGPENFAQLEKLAGLLGGTVGASRAVTDLDWVPHNLQIGQTGTTVAPDVYFACGISGAIQHLTGMVGSKYIVAINPDGDAPIHKHADLSIIDKWENIIPTLIEVVSKAVG